MAFLGSVGKALGIGNINKGPVAQALKIIFPVYTIGDLVVNAVGKTVNNYIQPAAKGAASGMNVPYPGNNYNITQGGYGAPPAYSVYFQEERQSSWDSSTDSLTMWQPTSWDRSSMNSATPWDQVYLDFSPNQ
jgi:hypothetical protein